MLRAVPRRFEEKVAIVTGAASGIGLATAKRLGVEGARLVVVDRDAEGVKRAAEAVQLAGAPGVATSRCDVAEESEVEASVALALARWERLDVIVNNAAIMTFAPLSGTPLADWQRVLGVNLLGPFFYLREALRRMRHGGSVVNVASVHALATEAQCAPYAASKAAMLSLTRSAAIEAHAHGLRVNAVVPGAIDAPMLWSNPMVRQGVEAVDLLGQPEDVAAAIAWLASDDAAFVNGAALVVDGGRLARL